MKSITLFIIALLLISSAVSAGTGGPGGRGGQGGQSGQGGSGGPPSPPDNATIIASLSTDEVTYYTCVSTYLQTTAGFASTVADTAALCYMHYYQVNTSDTAADNMNCGTVPSHATSGSSP